MSGIIETLIATLQEKVYDNGGVVELTYIIDFIKGLQENEYDAHVIISGQNGQGKSMLMLDMLKRIDSTAIMEDNIVYPFHSAKRLITLIKEKKESVIGIDELKKFFHYRESATMESIVLMNIIEYARSNRLAFVGCCNDIRRINSNYRNAKVQIVIWLIDRYTDDKLGKSYGLVFVGNPALEEEDKFNMNRFQNIYTFEQIRLLAEGSPTFLGYLFVEDIGKVVSPEEIALYRKNKEEGIRTEAEKYIKRLDIKDMRGLPSDKAKPESESDIAYKNILSIFSDLDDRIDAVRSYIADEGQALPIKDQEAMRKRLKNLLATKTIKEGKIRKARKQV